MKASISQPTLRWLLGTLLHVVAVAALAYWFWKAVRNDFTAELVANAPITVEYQGGYLDKKSPACGCFYAADAEWTGITFLSRRVALRTLESHVQPYMSYMLSAAFPSTVKPYSTGFLISAEYLTVRLQPGHQFDPEAINLLNPLLAGHRIVSRRTIPLAPTFTVYTRGSLYQETFGEIPISAWIPGSGGAVTISRPQDDSAIGYQLTETFDHIPGNTAAARHRYETDASLYSIIDMIGPRLVVWSEQPVYIFGGAGFTSNGNDAEPGLVHAFIINVPFALRTTIGALDGQIIETEWFGQYQAQGSDGMEIDPAIRGQLGVTLLESPNRPLIYDGIQRSIERNPVISACGPSTLASSRAGEICMQFRRPPMPARDGVNIFGRVQRLSFASVAGTMMVGARHFDLEPSVPLTVLEASGFENPSGSLTIPIQISDRKLSVSNRFAARGNLSINGEPVDRRVDQWASIIGVAGAAILLGSMIKWIYVRVRERPKRKKSGAKR